MIAEKLELTEELEEILIHRTHPFPHSAWYVDYSRYVGGYVPWHWHQDIEIMWVMQGAVKLTTAQGVYIIQQGEAAFLNSDVMHLQEPLPNTHTITLDQVFDSSLIAGKNNSIFEQKYVMPILNCRQMDVLIFNPIHANHRKIITAVRQAYDMADLQQEGYEVFVRNLLSEAWFLIFQEAQEQLQEKKNIRNCGEERLKTMMTYIHSHYHEKLSLKDIAVNANVSEREVLRAFRKWLQITPFQYLKEVRIRMACRFLKETSRQITDIAYECGFGSVSYFGKVFHEEMGMAPLEYRKKAIELTE
ncbi:MAG: helix-turn-helix transcriptional regulator [Lachnospiraceae bacterium]|nr:helix-turn-helix transcriptional regulator [Lachnospiraceae bacterium]